MDLSDLDLETRDGLPDALKVLLKDYPRELWEADPGFSDLVRFWLERHLMFRRVLDVVSTELEDVLDDKMETPTFAAHLSRYGSFFVQELHMHHTVEDHQYFPRLRMMDKRLEKGFNLLDRDHHAIDADLNAFSEDANAVLSGFQGADDIRPTLDRFARRLKGTHRLLDRHLVDEEELIVPVILKHLPSGIL